MATAQPIRLPFWVLIPKVGSGELHDLPPAFSETVGMSSFLVSRNSREWETRLINHLTLVLLIADLHALGSRGVFLDPAPDGSGGTEIPLSDLMKLT
jgi:hypothetical protein